MGQAPIDLPLIAVVVLGATLAIAGAMKLMVQTGRPTLLVELAARGPSWALAVALLPYVEFVLAAALVVPVLREAAALASFSLIAAFSGVLGSRWARDGDARRCGCFGSVVLSSGSSWWPLARNAALMVAAVVAFGGTPRARPGMVALAEVAAAAVVTSLLLSRALRAETRDVGPVAGRGWLDDALPTTDGGTVSVRRWLAAGRTLVVVFVDPLCGPCRSLLPDLARRQRASGPVAVAVVSRGPMAENVEMAHEFGLAPIAVAGDDELARRFGVGATPAALLLPTAGERLTAPALGRSAVLALLDAHNATTHPLPRAAEHAGLDADAPVV